MLVLRRTSLRLVFALAAGTALAIAMVMSTGLFSNTANKQAVAGLPLAAPLTMPIYVSSYSTYTGWATVGSPQDQYNRMYIATVTAWKWEGGKWVYAPRTVGNRVWVAPFAADWSWTWTSATGWRAMKDNTLIVRWEPVNIAT